MGRGMSLATVLVDASNYAWSPMATMHSIAMVGFACAALAVLLADRAGPFSRFFTLFCVSCIAWQSARLGLANATHPDLSLLYARLGYATAWLVVPATLQIAEMSLYRHHKRAALLFAGWSVGFIMAPLTALTPWVITEVRWYPWGVEGVWSWPGYSLAVLSLLMAGIVFTDWLAALKQFANHPQEILRLRRVGIFLLILSFAGADYFPSMGLPVWPASSLLILAFAIGCAWISVRHGWVHLPLGSGGRQLILMTPTPVVVIDETGSIRLGNAAAAGLVGLSRKELNGRLFSDLVGEIGDPSHLSMLARAPGTTEPELDLIDGQGKSRHMSMMVYDAGLQRGRPLYVVRLYDLDAMQRRNDAELRASLTDSMTGLPTKRAFLTMAEQAIKRSPERRFGLLVLSIANMRRINEAQGHEGGDELLVGFARRLEEGVPPDALIARIGGDEFAVLLDKIPLFDDVRIERLIRELCDLHTTGATTPLLNLYCGLSQPVPSSDAVSASLQEAVLASLQARRDGVGWRRFSPVRSASEQTIEEELAGALVNGQLQMYLQPVVSLQSNTVAGFEALVRWKHPERGLVLPGQFISHLESSALSRRYDRWALVEVCRLIQELNAQSTTPVWVSVNLTDGDLHGARTVELVRNALNESGVAPSLLHLEVTERLAMRPENVAALGQLKALGVQLSIDDFGTGYSSMSRLISLPLHTLKIDRIFVLQMQANPKSRILVSTLVSMARNLEMEVVAEGIETAADVEALRALGVDLLQGFLFSKAVPSWEAGLMVSGQHRVLPVAVQDGVATAQPRAGVLNRAGN